MSQNMVHAQHDTHPRVLLGIGGACLLFSATCLLLGLSTNQGYFLNEQVTSVVPNWGLVAQVPAIFLGGLDPQTQIAALLSWLIVLMYVVCGTCNRFVAESLGSSGKAIGGLMKWVAIPGIFFFDLYTSFNYGPTVATPGWTGHAVFTGLIIFGLLFFGPLGLRLVTHGAKHR